jgi:hypothetical protein
MSNYLAIATVTAVLQRTLQAIVQADVDGARVTTVRPDAVGSGTPEAGVNLYLYHVLPNPAWRNTDLRTRFTDGQFAKRPQAALDLYYLLSCYGNEIELEPQRLLGSVVRTLHARPVVTKETIRDTLSNSAFTFLADSNLAEQVETVKFMPLSMSVDELSNIWSVFFQTPHALSIAYQAGVVLIESDDIPHKALPVRDRRFNVIPNQPVIEQIVSQAGARQPIVANSTVLIQGKQLSGDEIQVRIGGVEVTPQESSRNQIILQLSSVPRGALRAGPQGLQVVHRNSRSPSSRLPSPVESNVAAFVLRPTITSVSVSNLQFFSEDDPRSGEVTVQVDVTIARTQRVALALNELSLENPAAYTFKASPLTADTNEIRFSIYEVKAGEYLVRLQVDGAESLLNVDRDRDSPTFEQYIGPTVVIA